MFLEKENEEKEEERKGKVNKKQEKNRDNKNRVPTMPILNLRGPGVPAPLVNSKCGLVNIVSHLEACLELALTFASIISSVLGIQFGFLTNSMNFPIWG